MNIDSLSGFGWRSPTGPSAVGKSVDNAAAGSHAPAAAGADFASVLGEAIAGVSSQLRAAEVVSVAGIQGAASTQQVVEQVMAAEQMLQTSIAVRDKIVAAYLEISRMSI